MSSSLTTVLNDVAEKFMKNNQKVEDGDLKEDVKQEIMRNNSVRGNEWAKRVWKCGKIRLQVAHMTYDMSSIL